MKGQGQKPHFQVISNDFFNVKINSQKVAATQGYTLITMSLSPKPKVL